MSEICWWKRQRAATTITKAHIEMVYRFIIIRCTHHIRHHRFSVAFCSWFFPLFLFTRKQKYKKNTQNTKNESLRDGKSAIMTKGGIKNIKALKGEIVEREITKKKQHREKKNENRCCFCINIETISVSVTFMKFYELYEGKSPRQGNRKKAGEGKDGFMVCERRI